jgi:hypothetical protein
MIVHDLKHPTEATISTLADIESKLVNYLQVYLSCQMEIEHLEEKLVEVERV